MSCNFGVNKSKYHMSFQSSTDNSGQWLSPDGRQTRIDFFNSGRKGKSIHVIQPKKANAEWWQFLTTWLRSSPKEQEHHLEEFRQFLEAKDYSKKTCRSYLYMLRKFFAYLDENNITEITLGIIEDYNYDFFVSGKYSRSYQLQFINGLTRYLDFANGIKINLKGLRKSAIKR